MTLKPTTDVLAARAKWRYRGESRPPFALPPAPGRESVWDYPRPPSIDADSRRVRVLADARLVAETTAAVRVLETASPPTFYLPPDDVDADAVQPTTRCMRCEWKGQARAYDVAGIAAAGWAYIETFPEFAAIEGYYAFYPAELHCTVAGETVEPQAGGYYGGWITTEIVGPFKTGDPETAWW